MRLSPRVPVHVTVRLRAEGSPACEARILARTVMAQIGRERTGTRSRDAGTRRAIAGQNLAPSRSGGNGVAWRGRPRQSFAQRAWDAKGGNHWFTHRNSQLSQADNREFPRVTFEPFNFAFVIAKTWCSGALDARVADCRMQSASLLLPARRRNVCLAAQTLAASMRKFTFSTGFLALTVSSIHCNQIVGDGSYSS